jgi:sugar lactone lactonase YvrE
MTESTSSPVSLVFDDQFDHPEGLVWDSRLRRLLWVDVFFGLVLANDLRGGPTASLAIGRTVGSVAPRRGGGLVCASREGFGLVSAQGEFSLAVELLGDRPYLQMNDGAVDLQGRFWAGSMALDHEVRPGAGALYRLDAAPVHAREQLTGVSVSNGIGWSPDWRKCYYVDSDTRQVSEFDFDVDAGTLGERRILAEVDGALPDGLAVDTDGCIWVALHGGWEVRRYTPSGQLDRSVRLPGSQVTTCAFGGADMRTLFIAVSARGLDEQARRSEKAGYIFAFEPGVEGMASYEFGA